MEIINRILKTDYINWRSARWLQSPDLKETSRESVEKLKNSIKHNGFADPFTVWEEGGNVYILDGLHRQRAMDEIESEGVIIPDKLPANFIMCKDRREASKLVLVYSSIYAKITQKGLADHIYKNELEFEEIEKELDLPDFDFGVFRSGFLSDPLSDPNLDSMPPLPKTAKTRLGDIYILDKRHRLMCGNSRVESDLRRLCGDQQIRLCFTSPPYNMNAGLFDFYADNMNSREFIDMNLQVIENIKERLRGFLFWNISYNKNARWEFIEILYKIVKQANLKFLELIVWNKKTGFPITSDEILTRQYESILVAGDDLSVNEDLELFCVGTTDKKAWFNKKTQRGLTNYWEVPTANIHVKELKACFPIALPGRAIETHDQYFRCRH